MTSLIRFLERIRRALAALTVALIVLWVIVKAILFLHP